MRGVTVRRTNLPRLGATSRRGAQAQAHGPPVASRHSPFVSPLDLDQLSAVIVLVQYSFLLPLPLPLCIYDRICRRSSLSPCTPQLAPRAARESANYHFPLHLSPQLSAPLLRNRSSDPWAALRCTAPNPNSQSSDSPVSSRRPSTLHPPISQSRPLNSVTPPVGVSSSSRTHTHSHGFPATLTPTRHPGLPASASRRDPAASPTRRDAGRDMAPRGLSAAEKKVKSEWPSTERRAPSTKYQVPSTQGRG